MSATSRQDDGMQTAPFRMRLRPITATVLAAAGLAGMILGMAAFLAWSELRNAEQEEITQLRMLARMVEDDAHRTLDSARAALEMVADAVEHQIPVDDPARMGPLLAQTLAGLQDIRAISVVDGSGRILASTTAEDVDRSIALDRLGPLPARGDYTIGNLSAGRNLSDLGAARQPLAGIAFLPLVARRANAYGNDHYVVVQVNPDALAGYQRRLLEGHEERVRSYLLNRDGLLVASSPLDAVDAGRRRREIFDSGRLRGPDRGVYTDDASSPSLVAYRISPEYPFVTVVEEPRGNVIADAIAGLRWLWWSTLAMLAAIAVLAALACRTIRQRERTSALLRSAEERLQDQLRLTHSLQEIAPIPLCMTDMDSRFLMVNRAWEEFMGLRRDAVLGRRNVDFLPACEAAVYDVYDSRLLREGGEVHFEDILRREDGTLRHVQVHKVAVTRDDGTVVGLLAAKLDVTAFRQAQATAEAASRSKSEFVANISHELRTPLQSILGFSELGLHRGAGQPKLAAMFEDIHASGVRMLELVNNLLDVSKIESTVGTFNFQRADVRDCTVAVVDELVPLLDRKRQRVELLQGPQPLIAQVDEVRIRQVIRNVLANAIKFSPEGSLITVSTDAIPGTGGRADIVVAVRDQGPGVPELEAESIFEPFVQSSRTQSVGGGTGLGLAICRKIADMHGGSVSAHNAAGGGAVFEIRLPHDAGGGATA